MSRVKSFKSAGSGYDKVLPGTAWPRVVVMHAGMNRKAELESRRRGAQEAAA